MKINFVESTMVRYSLEEMICGIMKETFNLMLMPILRD